MEKKLLYILSIILTPLSSAQIAESTESFLGEQIAGFLDTLVVTEVSSNYDILMYIIIPFLGVYGVTLYLTRKSFQIAEDNFTDASPGSSNLSDQAKKSTQLISVAISAITVSQFGGFTPVITFILALIAAWFFISNFYGVAQRTRYQGEVEQTVEEVETAEEELRDQEQQTEQTGDEEDLAEADAELTHVEQALENESEIIGRMESEEDQDLEKLLEKTEELMKHRKREIQALKDFKNFHPRSQEFRDQVLGDIDKRTLIDYQNIFLEFYENNRDLNEENFMAEWRDHSERNRFLSDNDFSEIDLSDLRSRYRDADINEATEEMKPLLDDVIEFEKGQMEDIREESSRLKDDLEEQEAIIEATRRFVEEVETLQEERSTLESLHNQLGDADVSSVDGELIQELREHIETIRNRQDAINEVTGHLEEMEGEEINLIRHIEDMRELHDTAQKEFGSWLLVVDLGRKTGQIPENGDFNRSVHRTLHVLRLFNIYMNVVDDRINDEEDADENIEEIVHQIHGLASRNLKILSRTS